MVSINYATREVTCKIVYYGPGLSGKTTNLQYIHGKVPANTRGKMISLATEADRTLYFDFLPINLGTISGLTAKFQLYTVPGQVYYNATRKLVLRGADGLVFVADSQADKMDENIESLNNMKENLDEYGYDINDLPIVIQYNKRDLPNILSVPELDEKLNHFGWKSFESEAVNGKGVFDTLKTIIKLVLDKAKKSQAGTQRKRTAVVSEKVAVKADEARALLEKPSVSEPAPVDMETGAAPLETHEETVSGREQAYNAEAVERSEKETVKAEQPSVEYNPVSEDNAEQDGWAAGKPAHAQKEPSVEADLKTDEESWGQERPFPGSTSRIIRRARRITVSDFQPLAREDATLVRESTPAGLDDKYESDTNQNLPSPTMAPSTRLVKKKRGFFKRLFGIK